MLIYRNLISSPGIETYQFGKLNQTYMDFINMGINII